MYVYKVMQARSTGEYLTYLIRKKPLHRSDAAFMHYDILEAWYVETMGV